jgi:hypothetical protein
LIGSLTQSRGRFMRSLDRLRQRKHRAIIVEASLSAVLTGMYRSNVKPTAVLGSIAAIIADGVPVYFVDDAQCAAQLAERLLVKLADRAQRANSEVAA